VVASGQPVALEARSLGHPGGKAVSAAVPVVAPLLGLVAYTHGADTQLLRLRHCLGGEHGPKGLRGLHVPLGN
jgi:hypothetical protein